MELKEPGCLDKLVAYMDSRPEVGIVSCKLVDESGQLNKKTARGVSPVFGISWRFFKNSALFSFSLTSLPIF